MASHLCPQRVGFRVVRHEHALLGRALGEAGAAVPRRADLRLVQELHRELVREVRVDVRAAAMMMIVKVMVTVLVVVDGWCGRVIDICTQQRLHTINTSNNFQKYLLLRSGVEVWRTSSCGVTKLFIQNSSIGLPVRVVLLVSGDW